MKLISEIINRRLEVQKDLDLNHDNIKAIWHFYQIYQICLSFLGKSDYEMKKKNILIKKLLFNRNNYILINKLKEHISKDSIVIEMTLLSFKESDETDEILEDFYPESIFGISIYDRGN